MRAFFALVALLPFLASATAAATVSSYNDESPLILVRAVRRADIFAPDYEQHLVVRGGNKGVETVEQLQEQLRLLEAQMTQSGTANKAHVRERIESIRAQLSNAHNRLAGTTGSIKPRPKDAPYRDGRQPSNLHEDAGPSSSKKKNKNKRRSDMVDELHLFARAGGVSQNLELMQQQEARLRKLVNDHSASPAHRAESERLLNELEASIASAQRHAAGYTGRVYKTDVNAPPYRDGRQPSNLHGDAGPSSSKKKNKNKRRSHMVDAPLLFARAGER